MEVVRIADPHGRPAAAGAPPAPAAGGPFALGDEAAWRRWRAEKLAAPPPRLDDLVVDIADLASPTRSEIAALGRALARADMAIYRTAPRDEAGSRRAVAAFARACGLARFESHRSAGPDGIVAIRVTDAPRQAGFIPYSDRPIGWHTDGYYAWDGPDRAIQAMVLHCVRPSREGGDNALLDPEIAYLRLRDRDPAFVAALMRDDAMAIPPCVEEDGTVRGETIGPVFFVDPATGRLGMRYTARKRHIRWRDDAVTRAAVAALVEIMADDPAIVRLRLAPGTGLLADNVLHDRSRFTDAEDPAAGRLLLRLRSYDRIALPRTEL
jgi:alpha-ketoglutarate-dependent taurine dioxygenase